MEILDPTKNKFLILSDGVKRSLKTDRVITRLDKYFEKYNHEAEVTSIIRDDVDQLRVINQYAVKYNLHKSHSLHYGDPRLRIDDPEEGQIYVWQRLWSNLLNIGVLINPPLRARVLMDYFRRGVNRRGWIINPSSHSTGQVFDIGGRGGDDKSVTDEVEVVSEAMSQDPDLGIHRFIIERKNNALHVICS